jgi:hypothetical protein
MKRKIAHDSARKPPVPPVNEMPADEHEEQLLDEALIETFPASDPISIPVPESEPDEKPPSRSRKER